MTTIERIEALKAGVAASGSAEAFRKKINANPDLRAEIRSLYKTVFHRELTGCSNCLTDAAFELIHEKKVMEKTNYPYKLKAGAILTDVVNQDSSKTVSFKNIDREDLILYHLHTHLAYASYFEELPEDWRDRVDAAYNEKPAPGWPCPLPMEFAINDGTIVKVTTKYKAIIDGKKATAGKYVLADGAFIDVDDKGVASFTFRKE